MKSVDEHLAEILAAPCAVLAPLELELEQALGTMLAEEVLAGRRCRRSTTPAMDGYAVRADVGPVGRLP